MVSEYQFWKPSERDVGAREEEEFCEKTDISNVAHRIKIMKKLNQTK